jgi:hypothetical protein
MCVCTTICVAAQGWQTLQQGVGLLASFLGLQSQAHFLNVARHGLGRKELVGPELGNSVCETGAGRTGAALVNIHFAVTLANWLQ